MCKLRVGLLLASAGLSAISVSGSTLYAVSFATDDFGTLNSTAGSFSTITTQPPPTLDGMGFTPDGTAMYATDFFNGVYRVNPATGGLTNLGDVLTYSPAGSTVGPDGLIYAVSFDTSAVFYTINPSGLAVNTINASLGFSSDGLAVFASGACTGGICFYTDTNSGDTLERVDPGTGVATAIGGLGVQIFAGANANGTVYGVGTDTNLYTINTTTGAATVAVGITGDSSPWFGSALAFDSAVPEPSSELLVGLGLGLAGLASAVRRWRRIAR